MTTAADYAGRKLDVLAFDGATLKGETLLDQVLARPGAGGKITAGVQKLAQRFLLELLTEEETLPYNPSRGCLFMFEARAGYFQTHLDVIGAFARAVSAIRRNLANDETDDDPEDERFASAELKSVSLAAGTARLYVELLSQAGTARTVLLPLDIIA